MGYDFRQLSPLDLEELARDLLQEEWGIKLESFKQGPDQGVDLRFASGKSEHLVVQCKHYVESSTNKLISDLRKEAPKVDKLQPSRYVVVTSRPLSPSDKGRIQAVFPKYLESPGDIYGLEDLNNLLGRHGAVERRHYKLWLSSAEVLGQIVHSDVANQTRSYLEGAAKRSRVFVQNAGFLHAVERLDEHGACVVSGGPGIGKTTLADMLLLHYVGKGFEPILVRGHIREAFKTYRKDTSQVFVYDDFLGATFLEDKLEKNEDKGILDFLTLVERERTTKLVMTTREYVLKQAFGAYEHLRDGSLVEAKYLLSLDSYSREERARILFNHIHFSELGAEYKSALCNVSVLRDLVDHPSYSPRVVQWMSSKAHVRDIPASQYGEAFSEALDNPAELWKHAYEAHVSGSARVVLRLLGTFSGAVAIADLESAFLAYRDAEWRAAGGSRVEGSEFERALEELEGTFVNFERATASSIAVAFENPAIADFVHPYICQEVSQGGPLFDGIQFYDQWGHINGILRQIHDAVGDLQRENMSKILPRVIGKVARVSSVTYRKGRTPEIGSWQFSTVEGNVAHSLRTVLNWPDEERLDPARASLAELVKSLKRGLRDIEGVAQTLRLAKRIPGLAQERDAVAEIAVEHIAASRDSFLVIYTEELVPLLDQVSDEHANDLRTRYAKAYQSAEMLAFDNYSESEDVDELEGIIESIREAENALGVDFAHEALLVGERIDDLNNVEYPDYDPDYRRPVGTEPSTESEISDEELLGMFVSHFNP